MSKLEWALLASLVVVFAAGVFGWYVVEVVALLVMLILALYGWATA